MKSKCCKADVHIESEKTNPKNFISNWWVCDKCHRACDVVVKRPKGGKK
jgi:hypothetical protein